MVLNIYLIRHAETDFNKKNSGFLQADNIELNSNGIVQLKDLSNIFAKIKLNKIYSSDLPRAKQTAELIFGGKNHNIISDERLREYTHGSFSPDSEEWKKKYKELFDLGYPREEIRPFGGENIWDLINRAKSFLNSIESLSGNLAIVAHSGVNEVLINLSQKRKKEDFLKIKQDNACINHLEYKGHEWKILTLNDTKHLENLKPEVEYYENIEEINKKLIEFIKNEEILSSIDTFAIGDLVKNKIGKYNRVFRKYFGTPIEIVADLPEDKIKKDWKIVHMFEEYSEYEIGSIVLKNVKYKINLILPKDYKSFISKTEVNSLCKNDANTIKQKILSFIYNQKTKKFLLLDKTKPSEHLFEGSRFTVTGIVEKKEPLEKAVERVIKEETDLDAAEIFSLMWGSAYSCEGEEFKEMNFITFVNSERVVLNEEHSKFEWMELDEFVKNIDWKENKALLKKVLEKAIQKEVYFDKKERGQ